MLLTCSFTCAQIENKRAHGRQKIQTITEDWMRSSNPQECTLKLKQLFGSRAKILFSMLENFKLDQYRERQADPDILDNLLVTLFQAQTELDTVCELVSRQRMPEDYRMLQSFSDELRWQLCRAYFVHATKGEQDMPACSKVLHFLSEQVRMQRFPQDVFEHLCLPLKDNAELPQVPEMA